MSKPLKKVGIIIPIYNTEKYLEECLSSVCHQSYEHLEIVLVNDGSSDENSFKIAKEYAKKDSRITLFDKENGGQASARNVGIAYFSYEYLFDFVKEDENFYEFKITNDKASKIKSVYKNKAYFEQKDKKNLQDEGIDYLQFVDSDDYIDSECIKECVERMKNVDMVWFDIKIFFDGIKKRTWHSTLEWLDYHEEVIISKHDWLQRLWFKEQEFFYCACQALIDFNFLKRIKLKFIEGIMPEDDHFGILLFAQANHIRVFPQKFYHYRLRAGSTMDYAKSVKINIPHFFKDKLEIFKDERLTKEYHSAASFTKTCLELIAFLKGVKDEKMVFVLTQLLQIYIFKASRLLYFKEDPLHLLERFKEILPYVDLREKNLKKMADKDLEKELSYTLGAYILSAKTKNLFKLISMLKKMIKQDKEAYENYKRNLSMYNLSFPHLKKYADSSRVQTHLSYKLSQASLKALKKPLALAVFILPFSLLFAYISFARQKAAHKNFKAPGPNLNEKINHLTHRIDHLSYLVWNSYNQYEGLTKPQQNLAIFINSLSPHKSEQEYFYTIFVANFGKKGFICVECNAKKGKMIDYELLFAEKIYVFEAFDYELLKYNYESNSKVVLEKKAITYDNFMPPREDKEGNGILPSQFYQEQREFSTLDVKDCLDSLLHKHEKLGILSLKLDFYSYKIIDFLIEKNYTDKISYIFLELDELFKQSKLFKLYKTKLSSYTNVLIYAYNGGGELNHLIFESFERKFKKF